MGDSMIHLHDCSECQVSLTCCCKDSRQSVLCVRCFRAKLIEIGIQRFRSMVEEFRKRKVA